MSNERLSHESTKSDLSSKTSKPKKLKQSHYKDLFKLYFTALFQRRLRFVYLPFIDEDIYILSNVAPYDLLADNHDASFGYVDLSQAEPYFKDLVREWFRDCFNGYDICIRLDYFMQVTDHFFGPKIIPGQDVLPVKDTTPPGEYPAFLKSYDTENEHTLYQLPKGDGGALVTVAWDTSEGFSNLPIHGVYKDFKKYLKDENIDAYPVGEKAFPHGIEEFRHNDMLYRVKPSIGFDALDITKLTPERSALVMFPVSGRAIQYGHYVKHDGVVCMITRPNAVLFPKAKLP